MPSAVKFFDVEEGSLPGGQYRIRVKMNSRVLETFQKNTMQEATNAFHRAGYKSVAWAEGPRIVLQEQ